MSWLLNEIAVALVVAGLIGIGLGLLIAWVGAVNTESDRTNTLEELTDRIAELEGRNLHLTESYRALRKESLDQAEIYLDTPRIA